MNLRIASLVVVISSFILSTPLEAKPEQEKTDSTRPNDSARQSQPRAEQNELTKIFLGVGVTPGPASLSARFGIRNVFFSPSALRIDLSYGISYPPSASKALAAHMLWTPKISFFRPYVGGGLALSYANEVHLFCLSDSCKEETWQGAFIGLTSVAGFEIGSWIRLFAEIGVSPSIAIYRKGTDAPTAILRPYLEFGIHFL